MIIPILPKPTSCQLSPAASRCFVVLLASRDAPQVDWGFRSVPQEKLLPPGRRLDMERGKTLGGSSAINYNMRLGTEDDSMSDSGGECLVRGIDASIFGGLCGTPAAEDHHGTPNPPA